MTRAGGCVPSPPLAALLVLTSILAPLAVPKRALTGPHRPTDHGNGIPTFPCAVPDRNNPVYYETSSTEWSWSPDGAAIVDDRAVGEVSQLRILTLATGEVRCITSGDDPDREPHWSPAGHQIVFVRHVDGVPNVHILHLEDGAIERVVDWAGGSVHPTFSHDGRRLAYVRLIPGESRRRLAIVRDLESGDERTVFDSPYGLNNLRWTPGDTDVLLYSIDQDGWNDIYSAKADGSKVVRITDNTVTDSYAAEYSPDSSRFLFSQGSDEDSPYHRWYNYDLYERILATGAVHRMSWSYLPDDRGHYAPDGRTIGFKSRRSGYVEISLMNADGTELRDITIQPTTELTGYVRRHGVAAGHARFDSLRRQAPGARLFSERAIYVLSRQFLAEGRIADAVDVARLGVATYPESSTSLTALGEALMAAGKTPEAHDILRRSLAINPDQYQLVFLLGFEDFFGLLDSIDHVWDEKADALLELVHWVQSRGDFLSAMTLARRLRDAHPEDPEIAARLAHTYLLLGDHVAAAVAYQQVLAHDPAHREARFQLQRLEGLVSPPLSRTGFERTP